jgi:hypothetical protein
VTKGPHRTDLSFSDHTGYGPFPSLDNEDHNRDRVKPGNVFNPAVGTDNLLRQTEGHKRYTASIQIDNLTNKVVRYNFLSTFSGMHFLQPRTGIARVGYTF